MTIARELVTLLRYQVDSSGLKQYEKAGTSAFGRLGASLRRIGTNMAGAGRNARAIFHGFNQGIRDGIREHIAFNRVQRQAVQQTQQMGRGYNAIGGQLRTLAAAIFSIGSARLIDEFAGADARVSLTVDDSELKDTLDNIFTIAQDAGQQYEATAGLFEKVNRNQKDLGISTAQSLQLTRTIGQAMTIGGGSQAAQQAALTQLGQALGAGVLRGDELNSIIEQAPALANKIAIALGTSVGKLKELGEQGKITAKAITEGLLKQSEAINAEFDRMPKTFGRGATIMRNAWGRFIYELNKGTRASERFYDLSKLVAENMKEIATAAGLGALVYGLMQARKAAGAFRLASLAALGPWLRMAAVVTAIALAGEDVLTWLRGGESVLGSLIGRSSEWQVQIDAVKGAFEGIKNMLGGVDQSTADFAKRWGTIGILIFGLNAGLKMIGINLIGIGKFLATRLLWPLAVMIGTVVGLPALVVIAIAAMAAAIIVYWDEIKAGGIALWDEISKGALQSWAEIKASFTRLIEWFTEKGAWLHDLFANMAPDWLVNFDKKIQGGVDKLKGTFGFGPSAATVQGSGRNGGNTTVTDARSTEINITGVDANPAAVGRAAKEGTERGYAPAVPAMPRFNNPNVEAMP